MTATSTRDGYAEAIPAGARQDPQVGIGEDLGGVIALYAAERITPETTLCLSQKFVSICAARPPHQRGAGLLAGQAHRPVRHQERQRRHRLQPSQEDAGGHRRGRLPADAGRGGGRWDRQVRPAANGDFYRIAGNHISEIDGFNPDAMPPFDQYAMLPSKDPDAICDALARQFGCAAYIIDGNNINVEIVGRSANLPLSVADAREVMLDNPMGQGDELTPVFLITAEG